MSAQVCRVCGSTVFSDNAEIVCRRCAKKHRSTGVAQLQPNAWHIIHTRYAAAISLEQWNEATERDWLNTEFPKLIPASCGCADAWKPLADQLDLSNAEAAFQSAWNAHNVVSTQHVQPPLPTITYAQCRAMYLGEQLGGRCVVTLATGAAAVETLGVSRPSLQAYAKHCGADYLELRGHTEPWWGLEKFRVRNLALAYDRCLFLDCDLLIDANCPNLFDLVPVDCVGIHDDYPLLSSHEWLAAERAEVFKSQSVPGLYTATCLNTGVVICSRQHADIWTRPVDPFPTSHCAEQIWIEYKASKYPIFKLPTEFNTQWWMKDFTARLSAACIAHWANCQTKANAMREFVKLNAVEDLRNSVQKLATSWHD